MPKRWLTVAVVDATPLELTDPCSPAVVTSTEITRQYPLDLSARRYARGPVAGRRSIDPVARRYARGPVAGKKIPPIVAGMPWLVEAPHRRSTRFAGRGHAAAAGRGLDAAAAGRGPRHPQPVAGSTRPQPVATR